MSGTLFVVGTPIGNLEDLTFRALRTLREVDVIAAEDTRRTSKLLAHYEVRKPLVSLHEHNETRETPRLIARMLAGEKIALVSDAGTPGIADPGAMFVGAAREAGVAIVPIPGASAVATALSVSGFPANQFTFLGFPPPSGASRTAWFETLNAEARTTVFFEAPHRIQRTLRDIKAYLVNRHIIICREITKLHEELVYEPIIELAALGEFTIVVSPATIQATDIDKSESDILVLFGQLTSIDRPSRQDAILAVARALSLEVSAVKKIVKNAVMLVK